MKNKHNKRHSLGCFYVLFYVAFYINGRVCFILFYVAFYIRSFKDRILMRCTKDYFVISDESWYRAA